MNTPTYRAVLDDQGLVAGHDGEGVHCATGAGG